MEAGDIVTIPSGHFKGRTGVVKEFGRNEQHERIVFVCLSPYTVVVVKARELE